MSFSRFQAACRGWLCRTQCPLLRPAQSTDSAEREEARLCVCASVCVRLCVAQHWWSSPGERSRPREFNGSICRGLRRGLKRCWELPRRQAPARLPARPSPPPPLPLLSSPLLSSLGVCVWVRFFSVASLKVVGEVGGLGVLSLWQAAPLTRSAGPGSPRRGRPGSQLILFRQWK